MIVLASARTVKGATAVTLIVRGLLSENSEPSFLLFEVYPPRITFYCSRELRGAPSRELPTADTGTGARVLASARTVIGITVVILIVRGLLPENF